MSSIFTYDKDLLYFSYLFIRISEFKYVDRFGSRNLLKFIKKGLHYRKGSKNKEISEDLIIIN
jgi:hypothetical protein